MNVTLGKIITAIALTTSVFCTGQEEAMEIARGRMRTECRHRGIGRIRTYDIKSADIPEEFEGFRICYVTDTHYASRFTKRTLESVREVLQELSPDMMLLGGDYQEGCEYVEPMMECLTSSRPVYGSYAVLGNNDYERCTEEIKESMARNGITLVEDSVVRIEREGGHINIGGAHNTFGRREKSPSPTLSIDEKEFVILLTHTPDYAEDQDIKGTDLALAGHTHGGQVTLFGIWAPKTASHYGQRFLRGVNYNSAGIPVITSNGIGTSRVAIRMFAKSEIILITLHTKKRCETK